MTALLGPPPSVLDAVHARAIDVLAAAGMLPPLRLTVAEELTARHGRHHDHDHDHDDDLEGAHSLDADPARTRELGSTVEAGTEGAPVAGVTDPSIRLVDTPPRHLPEARAVG